MTIDDDSPVASDYAGLTYSEGSGAHDLGNAVSLLGINAGEDDLQSITFTSGDKGGSLAIDGSGNLIYTSPVSVTSSTVVTETFSYTVTDNDGDAVTKQVTFGVSDSGITNVSATNELVDEDDIAAAPLGNPNGPGDDAPVSSGHISYTLGQDALQSITLSVVSTGLTTLGGVPVSTSWDAVTNTLTGFGANEADVVFTITLKNITATGADYDVVLYQPVEHPLTNDPGTEATETAFEDNLGFTVDVSVKDADNSEGTTSFTVTIDDDSPVFTSAQAGEVDNVADEVFHGTLNFSVGADQPVPDGSLSLIGNEAPEDLSVGGLPVSYHVDPNAPNVLIAYTGDNPNDVDSQVFTLVLNESGSYDFTLLKAIDNSTLVEIGSSTSFGAGPTGFQVLQDAGATQQLAVLSGWNWTGTPAQLQTWLENGVLDPALTTQNSVNGSTAGWGIGNNNLEGTEIFRIDFDDFDPYDSLVTDPGFNGPPVNFTTVNLINFADADQIAYVIHYTDGSFASSSGTVLALSGGDNIMTLGEAGKFIDYIEFMAISGNGKFDVVNVSTVTPGDDIDLGFDFTVSDADGDTVSGSLDVTVNGYEVTPDPVLIVGSTAGDDQDSIAGYTVGEGPGVITGDDAGDILVGDPGGTRIILEPGANYNISLIVDSSGSMTALSGTDGLSRMDLAKEALKHLVEQLADHDGTVNLQLVDFDSGLTVNLNWADINNLDLANIDEAIDNMVALGGTNYEAAFNASADWFNSLSNGFQNKAYFLTDGDPTYYLDGNGDIQGPGGTTNYDVMSNSLEAFVALSSVSSVHGIGIGNGVNEGYLKFFDNTASDGRATVPLTDVVVSSTVLADFNSSTGLNAVSGWTQSGDATGSLAVGSAPGNSFLVVTDSTAGASGAVTATSASFAVNATVDGSARLSFSYQTDQYGNSDSFVWALEKNVGSGWTEVVGREEAEHRFGWQGVEIDGLENGMYRLVFTVLNGQGGEDLVRVDNIVVDYMETAPIGQPEIVNTAAELEAALQGSSSSTDVVDAGDDVIVGHDGNDLIFGDSVNTDALPSTTPDGTGWGVVDSWDRQEVVDYIHANHAALAAESGRDGGHDLIYAGLGDDTVYGQEGNDVMYGGLGDDSLNGGSGEDFLVGGPGADTMAGGAGSDTFAYLGGDLDGSVDQITDFQLGDGGDKIDVSNVLEGYTPGNEDAYFKFDNITIDTVNNTASVDLSIDVNGTTGGANWTPVAHVEIQNFTGTSDQDVVQNMLDHNIVKPEMP
ncbi:RTX calcium-binding nonapeptide repeat [anaerobic digester metagenome]